MTRETICKLDREGEAYHIEEMEDGSVCLMRTTDVDDGPARSILICPEAVQAVATAFWSLSIRRVMKDVAAAIARVREHPLGRDL